MGGSHWSPGCTEKWQPSEGLLGAAGESGEPEFCSQGRLLLHWAEVNSKEPQSS